MSGPYDTLNRPWIGAGFDHVVTLTGPVVPADGVGLPWPYRSWAPVSPRILSAGEEYVLAETAPMLTRAFERFAPGQRAPGPLRLVIEPMTHELWAAYQHATTV